jgi:hypothetical protein
LIAVEKQLTEAKRANEPSEKLDERRTYFTLSRIGGLRQSNIAECSVEMLAQNQSTRGEVPSTTLARSAVRRLKFQATLDRHGTAGVPASFAAAPTLSY